MHCTIIRDAQAQNRNLGMFFHHKLLLSCKQCNKCMQHFTGMVFESVNYMREKIKKQPMLFLYMKAIQIFLELGQSSLYSTFCLLV